MGIAPAEQSRLVALALAALERGLPALPAADLAGAEKASLARTCHAVLTGAARVVAQAWLGYLPFNLAGGTEACNGEAGGAQAGAVERRPDPIAARLQETAPLCHAVIRLLGSQNEWGEASGAAGREEALLSAAGPGLGRAAALTQLEAGGRAAPRGWSADTHGRGPSPAIVSLAPSVLQDAAVTVAEAVAAAYLADVAAGTPPPALLRASSSAHQGSGAGLGPPAASRDGHGRSSAGGASQVEPPTVAGGAALGAASVQGPRPAPLPAAPCAPAPAVTPAAPASPAPPPPSLLEASLWPTLVHPQLASTRALQRFLNQVALACWVEAQYHSVQCMLEDRLVLRTLGPGGSVQERRVPYRRGAELDALTGTRFALSLLLEALDVGLPLGRRAAAAAGRALSWILVDLVGAVLALLARGVRGGLSRGRRAGGAARGARGGVWRGGAPEAA
ncbi:hypothetical protein ACKKBG_A26800 [Auxenochlorella protothecoides x Auxenochlorella symbiontica]